MKATYKKGQVVYQAHPRAAELGVNGDYIGIVVSRTVDACGAKQCTFADNGNDSTFGRKVLMSAPYNESLFATAEEAFAYLTPRCKIALQRVFSDQGNEWYDTVVEIRTRINNLK